MQTTLLGLALALIAAILAAFAAPLFIDWNGFRPQLEAQASALAGSRVTISGNIDLTLLPTPAFVLRNVSVGDADSGTGMRASEVRGSLSLTALLSGRFEADEFIISRPAIRIAIQKDGRLLLPEGAAAGQEISVGGFVLEAGSLTIEDRRTNTLLLADDFSARGELLSREGPFKLEGGFRLNGMRWILRASSGRFGEDHAGKVRLTLDRPADARFFEAEGTLSLANAALHFEGKVLASRKGGRMHWQVTADAAGDIAGIDVSNLELALGEGELPITLSGKARLVPRANGSLELSLTSKRIDLDLGDQKAGATGASHVLPWLARARDALADFPLPVRASLAADGVLAGGQLLRDVRAQFRTQDGVFAIERVEARLPGRSFASIAAKDDGKRVSGPLSFESEEPELLARWLLGAELAGKLKLPAALRLKATFVSQGEEILLEKLQSQFEQTRIGGRLLIQPGRDRKGYVLQADLEAEGMDFDTLLPAARSTFDAAGDLKFSLNLYAKDSRLLEKPLKIASMALEHFDNGLLIKNLTLDDLDGVSLTAKQLAASSHRYEFSAEAVRTSGLVTVLRYFSESADFARFAARYAENRLPIRIGGTLAAFENGWRLRAKTGEAEIALDLGEARETRRAVDATLRLPQSELTAKGEFRFGAERFEPVLALNFRSPDLRKSFAPAERAASDALPFSATANLTRDGDKLVFDKLAFDLAGTRGTGRVAIPVGQATPYEGNLAVARADARTLLALALGRAEQPGTGLGIPGLSDYPGVLQLEIGSLALAQGLAIEKAGLVLRATRSDVVFEKFGGELAGGKLTGTLRVSGIAPRVAELRLDLADASIQRLLSAKTLRGTLRANITASASGETEQRLIESLSGQGALGVSALEIDQTDATSVAAVFAAMKDAPDEAKVEQALRTALARGPRKV